MRKGFAKAFVVKRIYGKPGDDLKRYIYDLTTKISNVVTVPNVTNYDDDEE